MNIVAPVSRELRVSDAARTREFYRDVLDFAVRDEALVNGPARLSLEPGDGRKATYFFETDDVKAAHAALDERGAAPSNLVRVNRVKMEMFSALDPDGHTLWFGQSFDKPHEQRREPMLQKALPCLPVADVAAAVRHYVDVLGFHINHQQQDLGVMDRDDITILLTPSSERQGFGSMYAYVRDADELYAELKARGADVLGEPVSYPWGLRDFTVRDLCGNELRFGQPFE